jgi:O-antigen ligase
MPAMSSNTSSPGLLTHGVGLALALTQLVFLPSAHSPFRGVKMAWVLSILVVVVAGVCFGAARRGVLRIPTGGLALTLMTLPGLAALSALWSADPRRALLGAASTAVWIAAILVLSSLDEIRQRLVVLWVASGAGLSALVLVGQFFNLPLVSLPGRMSTDRLRLIGTAGNPADAAMAGVLMMPLLIPLLGRPIARHRVATVCCGAVLVAAFLSQSLTAWVSVGVIAGLGLVLQRSRRVWIGAGAMAVVAALVLAASPVRHRIGEIPALLAKGDWNKILSARTDGWTAALAMVEARPTVGVGNAQYSREFYPARVAVLERARDHGRRGEVSTHFEWAHNDLLEMAAELGMLGVAWMALFAWFLWRTVHERRLLALSVCAWLPFLLLHYPTHLAVGALPGALLLARFLTPVPRRAIPGPPIVAWLVAIGVAAAAWWTIGHQFRTLQLDRWRSAAEHSVNMSTSIDREQRGIVLRSLEKQAAVQIARHPEHAGWLWRLIGKARLADGRYSGAEGAFRRAGALAPHEEADFGLGTALLRQNRYPEAIEAYDPVIRMNPVLVDQVPSEEMRLLLRARLQRDRAVPP